MLVLHVLVSTMEYWLHTHNYGVQYLLHSVPLWSMEFSIFTYLYHQNINSDCHRVHFSF